MHTNSSYRVNRPTYTATNPQTQTGPITIRCTAKLTRSVMNKCALYSRFVIKLYTKYYTA